MIKSALKLSVLLLSISLLLTVSAHAQENTETRTNLGQRELEVKERSAESIEETQAKRRERRAAIVQGHSDRLTRRFTFYYERLSTVMGKVKTRLEEMTAEGKDVEAASAKIMEAQETLEEAKSLSDQAIAGFSEMNSEDINVQADEIRASKELVAKAREKYKEAVIQMKESIKLAKESKSEESE